ncbi:hypothetical protein EJV47_19730 [Hymenobacter gummosus]|uniref:Uncharacterized protein n=1 Tax=Hymenobacter gummosus TaxID=1776032 RepID=A0A3S0HKW4_9BACT|nr:hypothetical protein [Hymenobacter gummosus]RTQ47130.1 hypothetical protein EJV47_19730 [Hymenobacter gummosus]
MSYHLASRVCLSLLLAFSLAGLSSCQSSRPVFHLDLRLAPTRQALAADSASAAPLIPAATAMAAAAIPSFPPAKPAARLRRASAVRSSAQRRQHKQPLVTAPPRFHLQRPHHTNSQALGRAVRPQRTGIDGSSFFTMLLLALLIFLIAKFTVVMLVILGVLALVALIILIWLSTGHWAYG